MGPVAFFYHSEEAAEGTRRGAVEFLRRRPFFTDRDHDHRVWEHYTPIRVGKAGDHSVRNHWHAAVPALPVQHWRCPGQVL